MTGTGMSCTTLGKSDIDIVEIIARCESPGTFYTPYKGQNEMLAILEFRHTGRHHIKPFVQTGNKMSADLAWIFAQCSIT